LAEPRLPDRSAASMTQLMQERAWTPRQARTLVSRAAAQGVVETADDRVQLTPAGIREAGQLTRRHRVWEMFLIEGADIAADHVDRDADSIEHFLPPELIDRLEAKLAAEGRLPGPVGSVPTSPHPLTAVSEATVGE
jgi:manganese/zinc/iron transport system permease protein